MKFGTTTDDGQLAVLDALVDAFAATLKAKLRENYYKGRRGWDTPSWSVPDIKDDLIKHVAKNDPRDVAIYAAFWWNRMQ
jgi:hypothetical protein